MIKLLTLKEIAAELGVPESSVRKYREIFAAFIPSVGSGRSRRYKTDAVAIFQDIRHLREDLGMPWDAISEQLAAKYPIDAATTRVAENVPLFPQEAAPQQEQHQTPQAQQPQAAQPAPHAERIVHIPQHHVSQPSGDGYGALLKRTNAISEKQTMFVNAIAIELLRALDSSKDENSKNINSLRANLQNLFANVFKTLSDTMRDEKVLLSSIDKKLEDLCRITAEASAKPAPPAIPPGKHIIDDAKLAEISNQIKSMRSKIEQRDKMLEEYRTALDASKRETSELKAFKQRQESIVAAHKERFEAEEPKRKKPSIMGKIFRSKD